MIHKFSAVLAVCALIFGCVSSRQSVNTLEAGTETEAELEFVIVYETPPTCELYKETPPVQKETERKKLENVRLTHYCICDKCCGKTPDHKAYGITASGRVAEPYVSIAVDPDIIPLGSTVWLEYSDGRVVECRADDTGSAIKNARIDLCVSSHTEALELGIEYITVYWEVEENAALQ